MLHPGLLLANSRPFVPIGSAASDFAPMSEMWHDPQASALLPWKLHTHHNHQTHFCNTPLSCGVSRVSTARLPWRSVCFVYGQWHAQALWGLTECEHCQKRLEPRVLVCMWVCWLVDWWGDTSTDGGFRCDERHGRASSCPLGSASRKAPLLPSKLTRAAHWPHHSLLCLLVPNVIRTLTHICRSVSIKKQNWI